MAWVGTEFQAQELERCTSCASLVECYNESELRASTGGVFVNVKLFWCSCCYIEHWLLS